MPDQASGASEDTRLGAMNNLCTSYKGGRRLSSFTGDHLNTVVKQLLPITCHRETRDLAVAHPDRCRVHTSQFRGIYIREGV